MWKKLMMLCFWVFLQHPSWYTLRLSGALNGLKIQSGPQNWNQEPQLPSCSCACCLWRTFWWIWGHGGPPNDLRGQGWPQIELSDLNYLCSYASLACKCQRSQMFRAPHLLLLLKLCPCHLLISGHSAKRCPLIKTFGANCGTFIFVNLGIWLS